MKTHEELWVIGGTWHLDGRKTRTICEQSRISDGGMGILDSLRPYDDPQQEARLRLAAQAPAMARVLLALYDRKTAIPSTDGDIESVLRDAGVLPHPET